MKVRLLLLLALLALAFAGCGGAGEDAESVPAAWRIVRESFGHRVHVIDGDVKCTQCHELADAGFAKPPADLCKKCHDDKVATIHEQAPAGAETPVCQDCHGFGKDLGIKPNACMRCHAKPQGDHVQMIQIHSGATAATARTSARRSSRAPAAIATTTSRRCTAIAPARPTASTATARTSWRSRPTASAPTATPRARRRSPARRCSPAATSAAPAVTSRTSSPRPP